MTISFEKDPINRGLLFSLPFGEGTGVPRDVARPHHPMTAIGALVWTQLPSGLWCMDFDGTGDYLKCAGADTADLNFTAQNFSLACWINPNSNGSFISRGQSNVNGWMVFVYNNMIYLKMTNTDTLSDIISLSAWQLIGATRIGESVAIYVNGSKSARTAPSMPDPVTNSNDLLIGGGVFHFNGKLWNPRIWGRALAASEHMTVFQRERELFGV